MTALESLTTLRFPSVTPRNRVERLLAHFVDVHAGEGTGALLFALNLFLLLASYYMLKTAREALILSEGGAEVKSYSAAGQAILLLGIVPLYGVVASKDGSIFVSAWGGKTVSVFRSGRFSLRISELNRHSRKLP